MPLLIVESPAKCKKIQEFLGNDWKVIATMGHIRALEEDLKAVGIESDFEPRYRWILPDKSKAIAQLKEYAKLYSPSQIYLASDDDREGEAISYSVSTLLSLNPANTPRAVFHEITAKAVRNAVENPRRIDMHRVNAQQARAMLDMMIGFTMSPLLWKQFGFNKQQGCALSAGRCQIPALRLVVEREEQILQFKAENSWKINGKWAISTQQNQQFQAHLLDSLEDEESALNYMENHYNTQNALVTNTSLQPTTESPPKPLITSTLQQQASALFHIGPKISMRAAQTLYEAGHITYMRTDQAILSQEAITQAQNWIQHNLGQDFIGLRRGHSTTNLSQQGVQAAHEAIRPTHFEIRELPGNFTPIERKIYSIIWQRAIQSTMSPSKGEKIIVQFQFTDEPDFTWQAEFTRTTFPGWRVLGRVADLDRNDAEDGPDENLAKVWEVAKRISQGDTLSWQTLQAVPQESRPPSRYTEATLVRELEKLGIGRPSTFASLIATIQERSYVATQDIPGKEISVREHSLLGPGMWPPVSKETMRKIGQEKNKLVPTIQGRNVLMYLLGNFSDIFEYPFTARMETRLDLIADGRESWKDILRDTWTSYKDRYESAKQGCLVVASERRTAAKAAEAALEPLEGVVWENKPVFKKSGPYGPYVSCLGGKLKVSITDTDGPEEISAKIAAKAGGGTASTAPGTLGDWKNYICRQGPYGPYIMKKGLKKAQFAKLPGTIDPSAVKDMSENDIEALYNAGLGNKSTGNWRGGGRGGRGGRGGKA